jgi:undecaprenyl-diphosphatase
MFMALETILIYWAGNFRNPFLDSSMVVVTYLGAAKIVFLMAMLSSLALIKLKKYNYLALLWLSILGQELLIRLIKNLIARPRPEILEHLISSDGGSFPSGHSATAAVFYGLIGYILLRELKSQRAKFITGIILSVVILSVGISRIYLGVHWPTDVLGGYFIAFLWLALIIYIFKRKSYV